MSAFFLAINLDQSSFDQAIAERMQTQLQRYGHDGSELVVRENYALGYQRCWSVPEEVGERQPLYDPDLDLWLMLHGRIDNRGQLIARLPSGFDSSSSDAVLLLELYRELGEAAFKLIIGPFVFVLYSPSDGSVLAARDCMGGRYLVSRVTSKLALFATYEMALAAHPKVGYKLNPQKAVTLLTQNVSAQPTSMLAGMQPLLPGHKIRLTPNQVDTCKFYLPDPLKRIKLASHEDYAAEFRRLLDQAVTRRLRAVGPIGSMLSGGFDSVPITILAAQKHNAEGKQLAAYSWAYDRYPEADEREFSAPVCEDFKIKPNWVLCDDIWPQFDSTTAMNPIIPFSTPYSGFNQALFARAQQQGTRVLLSGIGGDMFYTGVEALPLELIRQGRWSDGWRELKYAWRTKASTRQFLRKYLFEPCWPNTKINSYTPEWVNPDFQGQSGAVDSWLANEQAQALRAAQYYNVVGTLEGEDMSYGRYFETDYQIERRYPFRDRDLVEFILAIPTEQLFYNYYVRPIVRRAFAEDFRPELKQRFAKTSFATVISAGIERDKRYRGFLKHPKLASAEYVKISNLHSQSPYFKEHKHVPWLCAYYEFWKSSCYTSHADMLGYHDE